jgi:hypothetical protein
MGTQRQPSRSPNLDWLAIISSRPNSKTPGLIRVVRVMGRPAGSTGFCQVIALAGLLINLDWSCHRNGWFSGRPISRSTCRAGPSLITMVSFHYQFFFLNINITLIWFLMLIKNSPGPLAAWELFHGLG